MDRGENHCPSELDALHADWNRSETTICLPSPSPLKRASTYLPKAGPKVLEESNTDPFYLEQSLAATPSTWDSFTPAMRDERFSTDNREYYTLSLTHERSSSDLRKSSRQIGPDRSTIAQLELENNLRFHRYTSSTEEESRPLHSSHESLARYTPIAVPPISPPAAPSHRRIRLLHAQTPSSRRLRNCTTTQSALNLNLGALFTFLPLLLQSNYLHLLPCLRSPRHTLDPLLLLQIATTPLQPAQ